jgi:hypothetical protein
MEPHPSILHYSYKMATSNASFTQTSNGIVVPHLQIPTRTNENVPRQQIPIPNRYTTVVYVEYVIRENARLHKWFSDIQMAWIWIRGQINQRDDRAEWDVAPFLSVANIMDREWRHDRGVTVAVSDSQEYEYCAYYDPTVSYDDVRDLEEYF